MADYKQLGNRWTAVYLVVREKGDVLTYRKLPFEIVRFNVDENPSAKEEIVPTGFDSLASLGSADSAVRQDHDKVYEKIWIVDSIPFAAKTSFGMPE